MAYLFIFENVVEVTMIHPSTLEGRYKHRRSRKVIPKSKSLKQQSNSTSKAG